MRQSLMNLKLAGSVLGLGLAGAVLGLALTNPDPLAYQTYAVAELSQVAKTDWCAQVPPIIRQLGSCESLIESLQPTLNDLFARNTQRRNYLLFSIYTTDLSPSSLTTLLPADAFPAYHFETLAMGQRFHTYAIEKR